jgi:predicted phage terminase large subunit-like protein
VASSTTLSPRSSERLVLRPDLLDRRIGSRNSPQPTLPSYLALSLTGLFDFSQDFDLPSPASDTPSSTDQPAIWTPPTDAAPATSLEDFVRSAWPLLEPSTPFVAGWHLSLLCEHLEAVSRGELADLLINVPPGTTKSLTIGVFWPAWEWTWMPWTRWLTTSYDDGLALRDAVKTRRLMQSAWYRGQLSVAWDFASDQNVKGYYLNDRQGWRIAASVNGAITGQHAHRVVVDDPHNVRRAESELEREATLTTWREVFPSRVLPGGARIVVGQRTHEQDVSQDWLDREGDQVHHLELQMELDTGPDGESGAPCSLDGQPHDPRTEDGELLAPERFPAEKIKARRRELGPYAYSSQYQQRPTPRAGMVLDPGLFKALPTDYTREGKVRVQFWDTAFSALKSADHTAAVTLDVVPIGEHMFVTHLFSERLDGQADPDDPEKPTKLDVAMVEHIVATRPDLVGVEKAAFKQKAIADLIRRVQRLLRARGISLAIKSIDVDGDKVTRAQIVAGRAQAGDIHADKTHPKWTAYAAQLSAFPKRKEDDYVDATSGAVTMGVEHVALLSRSRDLAGMAGTPQPIVRQDGSSAPYRDPKLDMFRR